MAGLSSAVGRESAFCVQVPSSQLTSPQAGRGPFLRRWWLVCNRRTKEHSGFDRAMEEVSQVPAKAVKLVALTPP